MTGVAVNVTGFPSQTGFTDGEMETLTGNVALPIMIILFELTELFPLRHVALDVSTHRTESPLEGQHVNVGLFVPASAPFHFH